MEVWPFWALSAVILVIAIMALIHYFKDAMIALARQFGRMDLPRAAATLMASSDSATSMSFWEFGWESWGLLWSLYSERRFTADQP